MSKTQTAATAHGKVSYETRSCANCGGETLADESVTVGIGLFKTSCGGAVICDAQVLDADEQAALCPHCAESLFGYTGRTRDRIRRRTIRTAVHATRGPRRAVVALAVVFLLGLLLGVPI